jgi:hypothetical protein
MRQQVAQQLQMQQLLSLLLSCCTRLLLFSPHLSQQLLLLSLLVLMLSLVCWSWRSSCSCPVMLLSLLRQWSKWSGQRLSCWCQLALGLLELLLRLLLSVLLLPRLL